MAATQLIERGAAERPTVEEGPVLTHDDGQPLGLWSTISRRTGLVLCLLGLLAAAASVVSLRPGDSPPPPSEPRTMPWRVVDASTVRTSGPAQLAVETMTYAAGQTSGWHSHPGLHLVSVISGTLTVYGPDCQPRTYGPGQPYIGGDTVHLARNEGRVPVEMGVTYLTMAGQSTAGLRVAHHAPTACAAH